MKKTCFTVCLLWLALSCKKETTPTTTPQPKATPVSTHSPAMAALIGTGNIESQHFTVNTSKSTILTGRQGTRLTIPQNAFSDADGKPVNGTVDIELKEVLTLADIALSGLTTTSNGKILESGGMVYVNASQQGKPLKLAASKSIEVGVPVKTKQKGMQYFIGVDDSINGTINWLNPKDFNQPQRKPAAEIFYIDDFGEITEPAPVKPGKPKANGGTVLSVKIQNPEFFPEISYIQNIKWQITDNTYEEGDAQKEWYGVDIDKSAKEGVYKLIFKGKENGTRIEKSYTVVPVFEGRDYEKAMEAYNKDFAAYQEKKRQAEQERKEAEQKRKEALKQQERTLNADEMAGFYLLNMTSLGWINCDRFLNDPSCKQVELYASVNAQGTDKISVYLVLTNRKLCLKGTQGSNGRFNFITPMMQELKLPIGEPVLLIATTGKDGKPQLAFKKSVITVKMDETLTPEATTKEKLKETITTLLPEA